MSEYTKILPKDTHSADLSQPFELPPGIDSTPFRHIRQSDLAVKRPELKRPINEKALESCVAAVIDTKAVLDELTPEGRPLYDTRFTESENAAHLSQFVESAVQAIDFLAVEKGHVTIAADLIGGLAPFDAVMKEVSRYPDLAKRVDVLPIFKRGFKPQKIRDRIASNGSAAFVHIDDGATYMTTQASALGILTGNPNTANYINEINERREKTTTCMDPSFDDVYKALIHDSRNSNFVILPFFMKNNRYRQLIGDIIQMDPAHPWARAQQCIMDNNTVKMLDEEAQAVGAMVNNLPCRDLGTNIDELYKGGYIGPDIVEKLNKSGLHDAEFRLLANERSLITLTPEAAPIVYNYFAQNLNRRLF